MLIDQRIDLLVQFCGRSTGMDALLAHQRGHALQLCRYDFDLMLQLRLPFLELDVLVLFPLKLISVVNAQVHFCSVRL